MHYHAEIIMPPTDDVEAAVQKIMAPFDENSDEPNHAFWDWYELGGRYSGSKLEAHVPQEKRDAFYKELEKLNVTVRGVVCGKQELQPVSQIPTVDALWREMCPGAGEVCPFFQHSGDSMILDTCRIDQLPEGLTAYTVIVACTQYNGELGAEDLRHKTIWNGVTHQDTDFSGKVSEALTAYTERIKGRTPEWVEIHSVRPDWLCVTVDYHC